MHGFRLGHIKSLSPYSLQVELYQQLDESLMFEHIYRL